MASLKGKQITASYMAREAARVWVNRNPSGGWFPSPLRLEFDNGEEAAVRDAAYGRPPGETLSLPSAWLDMAVDDAQRHIYAFVIQRCDADRVRDGRELMNPHGIAMQRRIAETRHDG